MTASKTAFASIADRAPLAEDSYAVAPSGTVVHPLDRVAEYPQLRYMGSKYRLLPWIHEVLGKLQFQSALDAFSGSGCVSYLMKAMGKEVFSCDFLELGYVVAAASVSNSAVTVPPELYEAITQSNSRGKHFIEKTFSGVFFSRDDLRFLDRVWSNIPKLRCAEHRNIVLAALARACVKKQPRGVFTVTGNLERYDDGRRDLRVPLKDLFADSVDAYNAVVFSNGKFNEAWQGDVFDIPRRDFELVYLDPPYVPRADDNCYIKRYHFLEGLMSYWQRNNTKVQMHTKSRKIAKRFTPFSYRRTCLDAFDRLFHDFAESTIVLSYSSNGYPDLAILKRLLRRYKTRVTVTKRPHRYHFGTHANVSADRASVQEYLVIGE